MKERQKKQGMKVPKMKNKTLSIKNDSIIQEQQYDFGGTPEESRKTKSEEVNQGLGMTPT